MSLFDTMKKDRLRYMKEGNVKAKDVLTQLIGTLQLEEKNGNELTDTFVISKTKKNLENAEEMLSLTGKEEFLVEADVYKNYIPQQMEEEELTQRVSDLKENEGYNNIGQFMKYFKTHYAGLYDGGVLSRIVRDALK